MNRPRDPRAKGPAGPARAAARAGPLEPRSGGGTPGQARGGAVSAPAGGHRRRTDSRKTKPGRRRGGRNRGGEATRPKATEPWGAWPGRGARGGAPNRPRSGPPAVGGPTREAGRRKWCAHNAHRNQTGRRTPRGQRRPPTGGLEAAAMSRRV